MALVIGRRASTTCRMTGRTRSLPAASPASAAPGHQQHPGRARLLRAAAQPLRAVVRPRERVLADLAGASAGAQLEGPAV
jgi:hypothetical protein